MTTIFAGSQRNRTASQEDISGGETRTLNGLALSPTMAAMCTDDFVRTVEFIRGTYAAIKDIREWLTERPARVLYVGCGPYASLALPLMTVFSPTEATFTLLDIHSESIASVKSIVETLGLANSIASFETMDAASYCISPDHPPDIILIEIMQACLESEPQVAVTQHLLKQAPYATLVPEEVSINLELVDSSHEFDIRGLKQDQGSIQSDRISVGQVFVVNREVVKSWVGSCGDRIFASIIHTPDLVEQRYQPMLFTVVRVYKNHILKDYDSGLTCPRTLSIEGDFQHGVTIQFYYELSRHPQLRGKVIV